MNKKFELLKSVLKKENLVELIAYFETVFQMSLLFFVQQSGFDRDDVIERLEEMGLQIDTDYFFDIINELVFDYELPNDYLNFDYFFPIIKEKAIYYALNEYIKADKTLLNKEIYFQTMLEEIAKGGYFAEDLDELVDNELPFRISYWDEIIDEKLCSQIEQVILNDKF